METKKWTRYELEKSNEYKAAKALENEMNDYGWNPQRFAESTRCMHRTLQQTLARTVVAVIRTMGADDFATDARNADAHEVCKKILESGALDGCYLPMV